MTFCAFHPYLTLHVLASLRCGASTAMYPVLILMLEVLLLLSQCEKVILTTLFYDLHMSMEESDVKT